MGAKEYAPSLVERGVPVGTKTTDYKRAFNAQKYDRIETTVPKGKKDEIRAHAVEQGETLNKFINRAIDSQILRDNGNDSVAPVPGGQIQLTAEEKAHIEKRRIVLAQAAH